MWIRYDLKHGVKIEEVMDQVINGDWIEYAALREQREGIAEMVKAYFEGDKSCYITGLYHRILAYGQEKEEPKPESKYMELIMAVGQKHPNESRHETALRYIREAERSGEDYAKEAK
jgi:hypothetical protein